MKLPEDVALVQGHRKAQKRRGLGVDGKEIEGVGLSFSQAEGVHPPAICIVVKGKGMREKQFVRL
jgi:hypothetical protein